MLGSLLEEVRRRWGAYELVDHRCPENPEFQAGALPIVGVERTEHWFDPCALLLPDARSEYREEFRARQCGGGWLPRKSSA
jgi:hypothetical protein